MIPVGFSGRKGSGKTSIAEYLINNIKDPMIIGFANAVKESYLSFFGIKGLDVRDLNKQDVKDSIGPHGKTHRQALQEFGVAMRKIDPDIWVRKWRETVDLMCRYIDVDTILVPDVRFPNEVKAIHDMGGPVIRLTRCPHPEDTHESETALDYLMCGGFDLTINNKIITEPEQNEIALDYIGRLI